MADTKISALTDGANLQVGDILPIVRGGANRRATYNVDIFGELAGVAFWSAAMTTDYGNVHDNTGAVIPGVFKFLVADARAISSTNYAALYAMLTAWGGPGVLPDLRGRTLIANGVATGAAGATNQVFGTLVGEQTHVLTTPEMPEHTHTYTRRNNAVNNISGTIGSNDNIWQGTTTVNTGSAGSGTAHNNMQPSAVGTWFIYTGLV